LRFFEMGRNMHFTPLKLIGKAVKILARCGKSISGSGSVNFTDAALAERPGSRTWAVSFGEAPEKLGFG
jgi:hypothetical protein